MVLEIDQIIKLVHSTSSLNGFMGFLSVQETDRLAEVLQAALLEAEQSNKAGNVDYNSWARQAKDKISKELTDSQALFGFMDLADKFPIDEFLQAYYNSANGE